MKNNGYNRITKASGFKIYGTIAVSCGVKTLSLWARNNQWFYPTNGQPVQNTDYYIYKHNCTPQEFFLISPVLPLSDWSDCGGSMAMGGDISELSTLTLEETSIQSSISDSDYTTAFDIFYNEIISQGNPNTNNYEELWEGMKLYFGKIKSQNPALTNVGSNLFNKMEQGLNKMKQVNNSCSKRLYFLNLEHATLYRSVGDLSTAIQKLNSLLPTLADQEEIDDVQYWLCICETERDVITGSIAPQDIESYASSCDTNSTEKHMIFNNPDANNTHASSCIVLSVVPNPVTAQSMINVEIPDKTTATVEIIDSDGKSIKSFSVSEQKTSIGVRSSDLPKGIYTVKVLASDGQTKTTRMVIQ